jgi:hypothetical protein
MSTYLHCPLGGVVCTICHYAINFSLNESMIKAIKRHERTSKNHKITKTTPEEVEAIVFEFDDYNKNIAGMLHELREKEVNRAVEYLKPLLDMEKKYDFCRECNVLVKDKENHHNRQHSKYCNEQHIGLISKFWTSNNPKIYNCNISLVENIDQGIFCQSVVKAIDNVPININGNDPISNNHALQNILDNQEIVFSQNAERTTIQVNNQQTNPDLWVLRNGWDLYFKNYIVQDIAVVTDIPDIGSVNYRIEQQFKDNIMHAIHSVKKLDPNHILFWDIQKKLGPNYKHPNKPYRLPNMITFDRYVRTILSIVRVILYMYINQKNENNIPLPEMIFSGKNKEALDQITSDKFEGHLEYIWFLLYLAILPRPDYCASTRLYIRDRIIVGIFY